jgi:hypothetical protein
MTPFALLLARLDWTHLLVVDAALLVIAVGVILVLFFRDLRRM